MVNWWYNDLQISLIHFVFTSKFVKSLLRREAFCVRIIYKSVFDNLTILSTITHVAGIVQKTHIANTNKRS